MPGEEAWLSYLHRLRDQELHLIFGQCPDKAFDAVLEMGAGDGHQSKGLLRYAHHLVAFDYTHSLLPKKTLPGLAYLACDASQVGMTFKPCSFDVVYSSNLLEHVSDLPAALQGVSEVLRDGGLAVHVIPNRFWVLCHVLLYWPAWSRVRWRTWRQPGGYRILIWEFRRYLRASLGRERVKVAPKLEQPAYTNNPTLEPVRHWAGWRFFIPEPHGISATHRQEWQAFATHRWRQALVDAGFEVLAVKPGVVSSGYGFGWDRLRRLLAALGFCTERVYFMVKKGQSSNYSAFFGLK